MCVSSDGAARRQHEASEASASGTPIFVQPSSKIRAPINFDYCSPPTMNYTRVRWSNTDKNHRSGEPYCETQSIVAADRFHTKCLHSSLRSISQCEIVPRSMSRTHRGARSQGIKMQKRSRGTDFSKFVQSLPVGLEIFRNRSYGAAGGGGVAKSQRGNVFIVRQLLIRYGSLLFLQETFFSFSLGIENSENNLHSEIIERSCSFSAKTPISKYGCGVGIGNKRETLRNY